MRAGFATVSLSLWFLFPHMDQVDLTGPFEVVLRMPDPTVQIIGKEGRPKSLEMTGGKTRLGS